MILFKAKALVDSEYGDYGEWIEGFYVCFNEEEHRIYTGYAEKDCGAYYPDFVRIDPKTVRQCTGICDKNGNMIFEGDIHCNENNNKKFVVKFGHFYDEELLDDMYGWYMEDNWNNRFGLNGSEYEYANIIGNTIDNPKLMGE